MSKVRFRICIIILALLYSCTTVTITRHPDYHYAPTNHNSVIIYDRFTPTYKFIIIGRIDIDATWTISSKEMTEKIQEKAAAIGGDAVIITDKNIDIYAFNQSVTTEGSVTRIGDIWTFSATNRDSTIYVPIMMLYGYVIKRQTPPKYRSKSSESFSHSVEGKSFIYSKIKVKIVRIKNYIDFTVLVGDSVIILIKRKELCREIWRFKEDMDVEMLYIADDYVVLYLPDGKRCRFKRIG